MKCVSCVLRASSSTAIRAAKAEAAGLPFLSFFAAGFLTDTWKQHEVPEERAVAAGGLHHTKNGSDGDARRQ